MAVCKPHFMEIVGTSFAFVGGITAGGLLLGFLNSNQNFDFNSVPTGNLLIHQNAVTGVGTFVASPGTPTCAEVTYPVESVLNQVKMNESKGGGIGFLAGGIVAIIAGVFALGHLAHLVRLRWQDMGTA